MTVIDVLACRTWAKDWINLEPIINENKGHVTFLTAQAEHKIRMVWDLQNTGLQGLGTDVEKTLDTGMKYLSDATHRWVKHFQERGWLLDHAVCRRSCCAGPIMACS